MKILQRLVSLYVLSMFDFMILTRCNIHEWWAIYQFFNTKNEIKANIEQLRLIQISGYLCIS